MNFNGKYACVTEGGEHVGDIVETEEQGDFLFETIGEEILFTPQMLREIADKIDVLENAAPLTTAKQLPKN